MSLTNASFFVPRKTFCPWPRMVAGAMILSLAAFGFTQDAFDYHSADLTILQAKPIQNAIGISAAQRSKMNSFAENYASRVQAYKQQLIKAKKTQFDANKLASFQIDLKNKVFAQLSPAQLKRLREISLQHDGIAALGDETVATKVGLSASQLKQVRAVIVSDRKQLSGLEEAAAKPVVAKYKNVKPKSQADQQALVTKFKQEMSASAAKYAPQVKSIVTRDRAKIMGILSGGQKATWTMLLGKPFKG